MDLCLGVKGEVSPLPEELDGLTVERVVSGLNRLLTTPFKLEKMILSTRAVNVVQRNKLATLFDLLKMTPRQIANIKHCGSRSRGEIVCEAMRLWGVYLENWTDEQVKPFKK